MIRGGGSSRDRGWRVLILDSEDRRTYLGPVYASHRVAEAVRKAWLGRNGRRLLERAFVVHDTGLAPEAVEVPTA